MHGCRVEHINVDIWKWEHLYNPDTYYKLQSIVLHYSSLENQAWEIGTPSIFHTFHHGIVAATPLFELFSGIYQTSDSLQIVASC